MSDLFKSYSLHLGVILILLLLHFILPEYHHGILARILVLSVFAMGYNITFGYTGLLSLGHALFFSAGMYAMGLAITQLNFGTFNAFLSGIIFAILTAGLVGALALRTKGVSLMIVTLMFAQAGWYVILYFGSITRGDEGFIIPQIQRAVAGIDLSDASNRYLAALLLFALILFLCLKIVHSRFGKVIIAIRENEERAVMLGYNVYLYKLVAVMISGGICGLAGASYGLLFGYVGATFATVQYSILPLLWVLLGGASTVLGPFVGTLFMTYLIDITSNYTQAYMAVAGVVLVLLTLYARQGIVGEVRKRFFKWLP